MQAFQLSTRSIKTPLSCFSLSLEALFAVALYIPRKCLLPSKSAHIRRFNPGDYPPTCQALALAICIGGGATRIIENVSRESVRDGACNTLLKA